MVRFVSHSGVGARADRRASLQETDTDLTGAALSAPMLQL